MANTQPVATQKVLTIYGDRGWNDDDAGYPKSSKDTNSSEHRL